MNNNKGFPFGSVIGGFAIVIALFSVYSSQAMSGEANETVQEKNVVIQGAEIEIPEYLQNAWDNNDYVFHGIVTSKESIPMDTSNYKPSKIPGWPPKDGVNAVEYNFEIIKKWKGEFKNNIVIKQFFNSKYRHFRIGEEYIVFAQKKNDYITSMNASTSERTADNGKEFNKTSIFLDLLKGDE